MSDARSGQPAAQPAGQPLMGRSAARFGAIGMPVERPKQFGASARRLVASVAQPPSRLVLVAALAVSSVTLNVLGPRMLGHATDIVVRGLRSDAGVDFARLHRTLLMVLALFLGSFVLSWVQAYLLAGMVHRAMYRLRADVEDKLHRFPLGYIDEQARGDLLSRVTNDVDNIAQSLSQTLSQLLTSVLMVIGVVVMMFVISPLLAIVAIATIPACLVTIRFIARRSRKGFIAQWRHTGVLNAHVEETFTGHAIVKAFGRQRDAEARFQEENELLYHAGFRAQFVSSTIQPATTFLSNLTYVLVAVLGGLRVSSGSMTLGEVQAFVQYARQFGQPITQAASMSNVLQSGVASAERLFELLDAEEERPDDVQRTPVRAADVAGRIEFDHVSFSYDPSRPLIKDLSLVAEPGRTVAIVGPTGAGKTTLVNLLMRFYELDAGRITLDGRDIATMARRELRSHIGMVLQDAWLFGGTIRDNIAYGDPDASDERILEAARAAYVDRFVHSLPDGYATVIDDEGGNVSAGEKQLLTIARAFLSDPSILILDEATSSVDTRTEVLVQQAMAALRSNRTSFVIAHRLSTIRDADVILVMDGGRIVEQGSHDDLLTAGGAYAALYSAQFQAPVADVS